jgi:hypothetical protein
MSVNVSADSVYYGRVLILKRVGWENAQVLKKCIHITKYCMASLVPSRRKKQTSPYVLFIAAAAAAVRAVLCCAVLWVPGDQEIWQCLSLTR